MASGGSIGKKEDQKAQEWAPPSSHAGTPIQGRTAHGSGHKTKGR